MPTTFTLTPAEEKLAEIIWRTPSIASSNLAKLAATELGWAKSTTYTMLKILIGKGIVKNENATVMPLYTREEVITGQSRSFVEDTFGGSLPKFITSFIGGGKLSAKDAAELVKLINDYKEQETDVSKEGGNG